MISFKDWKEFNKDLYEFLEKRHTGAKKIAKEAKNTAILTFWHFSSKLLEYDNLMKMVKKGKGKEEIRKFCIKEFKKYASEASSIGIEQKQFQSLAGKFEVYGEVISFLQE